MMDLTVIIVNYNTKELLEKCLESVVSGLCLVTSDKKSNILPITNYQSPTTEIIVVDNGSTDGSVEMLKKLLTTNHQPLITIRIIENKENLGFARAVNQALRQAQGKVILLLNSDTVIKENALSELLKFEKKVGPAIIGARLLNPDKSVQASVFHLPTVKRAIEEFWLGKKNAFSKYAPDESGPVEVQSVVGGAMLISKEVIKKIGLFDERYFMYFEDLDYCRKARKAGFKVYYLPSVEIVHEHGASGRQLVDSKNQWKRLIPSSKIYHGYLKHFLIWLVLWFGQRIRK